MTTISPSEELNLLDYLLSVADLYGAELQLNEASENYSSMYTGSVIPVPLENGVPVNRSDLLHELAHYIYATYNERKDPRFGLGPNDGVREIKVFEIQRLLERQTDLNKLHWEVFLLTENEPDR